MKTLQLSHFIAIILFAFTANAQQLYSPSLACHKNYTSICSDWSQPLLQKIDSVNIVSYGDTLLNEFFRKGHLAAGIDSIEIADTAVVYHLYPGEIYTLNDLDISPADQIIMEGSGISKIDWSKRTLNEKTFKAFQNKVLSHLANSGYPFASMYLDSISIKENLINSKLVIDKNEVITYDSMLILGTARVNKSYLHRYLDLPIGGLYNQKNVLAIKRRIKDLSFMEFKADPSLSFVNGKSYFTMPLNNRNASKFDFIIGVLPITQNGIREWTITGDFTGDFINKLGNGESISIKYQQIKPETQELKMALNYPYLFNLPFGIDGNFELYRNSSTFLDLTADLGIQYQLSGKNYLKIGWNFKSSRLIEVDTNRLIGTGRLPEQLDVNVTSGGVSFLIDRLNYTFNPSSGYSIKVNAQAGQKKVIPNLSIISLVEGEVNFQEAYDTIKLTSFQTQLTLDLQYFVNIKNWSTIRIANSSAYKYNQTNLYSNEYFRIGGNKLLRGFNEQAILSPFYSVFTTEFRIILDQLSYISLPFIDYGFTQVVIDDTLQWDNAIGVGLGLNFGTPAGIFNISFASGNRLDRGFNFSDTKIHFGYVNLF